MLLYFCLTSLDSPKALVTVNEVHSMSLDEEGDTIKSNYYNSTDVE